jgi:thiosulfate reductase cytochrome b subunit
MQLEHLLGFGLIGSLIVNFVLAVAYTDAKYGYAHWRRRASGLMDDYERLLQDYMHLRSTSHRRDPKTGRLMRRGE